MINRLLSSKSRNLKFNFILHTIVAICTTFNFIFIVIWFYFILITGFYFILNENYVNKKIDKILFLLAYLIPFELIGRMSEASPYIPYEVGKYLNFIGFLFLIVLKRSYNLTATIFLLLLLPGLLIGFSKSGSYEYLVFNCLGLINIGLGIMFWTSIKLNSNIKLIKIILRLMLYPLFMALIFAVIKSPNYTEMNFILNANTLTSGGFGSNQVSTAFGFSMFILFYLWLNNNSFSGVSLFVDFFLICMFLFQGLLTFSRGGIIGGALCVLVLALTSLISKKKDFIYRRKFNFILFSLPLIILVILLSNKLTGGNLFLRYSGETYGTLMGDKENDFNHLTSNRYGIMLGDLSLFLNNIFLGVGVGESSHERVEFPGIVAHTEFSRLLSEHGLFGLLVILIILYYFISKLKYINSSNIFLFLLCFIAIYTSFHAATRTFVSSYILGFLAIDLLKKKNIRELS